MDNPEKKSSAQLIINIVVLIVLVIAVAYGIWAHKQIVSLTISNTQTQDFLAVCNDVSTSTKETACVDRLSELSNQLAKYELVIKNIQVPATQ